MTDDDKALVKRLRDESIVGMPMENEAADSIEAQAAEIERLRALFGRLIKVCEETSFDGVDWNHWVREEDDIEHFRAALGESND